MQPGETQPASILDGIPVVNQAFKSFPDYVASTPATYLPEEGLSVVSSCPKCGSPIYGPRTVPAEATEVGKNCLKRTDPPMPRTVRTCGCVYMPRSYADQAQTK